MLSKCRGGKEVKYPGRHGPNPRGAYKRSETRRTRNNWCPTEGGGQNEALVKDGERTLSVTEGVRSTTASRMDSNQQHSVLHTRAIRKSLYRSACGGSRSAPPGSPSSPKKKKISPFSTDLKCKLYKSHRRLRGA